ncbi:MAG: non-canonical purine NTP pyrophosphatase, RdgB/HAM1 family [Epulopiscium sp. Nuni2H_MBin001]|nr:MAG: non-canonical purine NTP pyrophosphatase, RdgB/HAM1 family [Epulopiscium sp. Nuni2H_MBin001]
MKKVIFATQNLGKIKEIQSMLDNLEVVTMAQAGFNIDIKETGDTFVQNAIIKAETLAKFTDVAVIADDSGLEIDFLNKQPGVHSARYLGKETPYGEKNIKILEQLHGVEKSKRTARFVCAMAVAKKGLPTRTVSATLEGFIGYEAKGDNGFGYDPIFYIEDEVSLAMLSQEQKNAISHRGQALQLIANEIMDFL